MIETRDITGLVLAGGLARRMGGVDKGLQPFRGEPLARRALQRLRPQVGQVALNAPRDAAGYAAAWGVPVWPDTMADHPGPLAGFLAGLVHGGTPWVLAVPCDTPFFPPDLAQRLAHAAERTGASLAIASAPDAQGRPQPQPVFCLLHARLADSLRRFLAQSGRKARTWAEQEGCAIALFDRPGDDPLAFRNANTLAELQALEGAQP